MSALDFPELSAVHMPAARLYATRRDLVADLKMPPHSRIAEIGVGLGDFSRFMIETFSPSEFHAFDTFLMHRDEMVWGRTADAVFQGKTHLDFYREAMAPLNTVIKLHVGESAGTLKELPASSFDLIYVDGAHNYELVRADAEQAARLIRSDGVLIFNDYVLYDPFIKSEYGVVQAVNELIVNGGWQIHGFALQKHMFCDVSLVRPGV